MPKAAKKKSEIKTTDKDKGKKKKKDNSEPLQAWERGESVKCEPDESNN